MPCTSAFATVIDFSLRLSWLGDVMKSPTNPRFILIFMTVAMVVMASLAQADSKAAWKQIEKFAESLDSYEGQRSADPIDQFALRTSAGASLAEQKAGFMALLDGQLEAFLEYYPADKRVAEAQAMRLQIAPNMAEGLGLDFDDETWIAEVNALRSDPQLPADAKVRVQVMWINYQLKRAGSVGMTQRGLAALIDTMEYFVFDYRKDTRSIAFALIVTELIGKSEPQRAEAVLKRALKNVKGKDPQLQNSVEQALALLPFRSHPIDLEFEAADGTPVDLAQMRGQVIVVDFWASWCPPCRHESPDLVELYQKYRADGLQIIGISLDESRAKMEAFAEKVGMDWPHYFDGRGWRNRISTRFAISSIPAVWVIDRDGYLVNAKARGKLEQWVPRLLARPMTVAQR